MLAGELGARSASSVRITACSGASTLPAPSRSLACRCARAGRSTGAPLGALAARSSIFGPSAARTTGTGSTGSGPFGPPPSRRGRRAWSGPAARTLASHLDEMPVADPEAEHEPAGERLAEGRLPLWRRAGRVIVFVIPVATTSFSDRSARAPIRRGSPSKAPRRTDRRVADASISARPSRTSAAGLLGRSRPDADPAERGERSLHEAESTSLLEAEQVVRLLAGADQPRLASWPARRRGAAGVVVRRHRERVCAGHGDGEQVAARGLGQLDALDQHVAATRSACRTRRRRRPGGSSARFASSAEYRAPYSAGRGLSDMPPSTATQCVAPLRFTTPTR